MCVAMGIFWIINDQPKYCNYSLYLLSLGVNGICKPASNCAFLRDDDDANVCKKKGHVCCKQLLQNDLSIIEQLAASIKNETLEKPEDVSFEEVNELFIADRLFISVSFYF